MLAVGALIITFGYRRSIMVLLGTLVLGVLSIIWYAEFYEEKGSDLIGVDEVTLDSFSMRKTYGDSYELTARIRNRSPEHVLTALGIELTASDCETEEDPASCVVVGQQSQEVQIDVPAQQARDVVQQFIFPTMRPKGSLKLTPFRRLVISTAKIVRCISPMFATGLGPPEAYLLT